MVAHIIKQGIEGGEKMQYPIVDVVHCDECCTELNRVTHEPTRTYVPSTWIVGSMVEYLKDGIECDKCPKCGLDFWDLGGMSVHLAELCTREENLQSPEPLPDWDDLPSLEEDEGPIMRTKE